LGGIKELPLLIERQKVSRVIIVSELKSDRLEAIRKIAGQCKIKLSEWQPEEHELMVSGIDAGQTKNSFQLYA
jgi:hypothetical protein